MNNNNDYYTDDRFSYDDRYDQYAGSGNFVNNDPQLEEILRSYPDARRADQNDAKSILRRNLFLGMVFVVFGIIAIILSVYSDNITKDFFAHAEEVDGVVINVYSHRTGSSKHRRTVYDVTYMYTYEDKDYYDKKTLSSSEASSLGVRTGNAVGNIITVYVDIRNPKSTRIIYSKGVSAYFPIIFCVVGIIIFISGFLDYKKCREGKLVIYHRGRKTYYKRLR